MVSKHFHPFLGGLENRVLEISRWLVKKGDEVLVLTCLESGTAHLQDLEGILIRRSRILASPFNAVIAPGVLWGLLTEEYDVIDVNLPDPAGSIWTIIASIIRRKPVVVTYHADILAYGTLARMFKKIFHPFEKILLQRASSILVTSKHYALGSASLTAHMDKAILAPSFIDPERFNTSADPSPINDVVPKGSKPILFVGRLVPYKGIDNLINAFSMIECAQAVLVIAGSGPLMKELKAQAQGLGISERVFFCENVDDTQLPGFYRGAQAFALASVSRQEAFGLVLVESMACGTPAVSSDFSGMPFVIGDDDAFEIEPGIRKGQGGLLVPPKDADALRRALQMLIKDSKLSFELSKGAQRRVADMFTREKVCEKVREAYIASSIK